MLEITLNCLINPGCIYTVIGGSGSFRTPFEKEVFKVFWKNMEKLAKVEPNLTSKSKI